MRAGSSLMRSCFQMSFREDAKFMHLEQHKSDTSLVHFRQEVVLKVQGCKAAQTLHLDNTCIMFYFINCLLKFVIKLFMMCKPKHVAVHVCTPETCPSEIQSALGFPL